MSLKQCGCVCLFLVGMVNPLWAWKVVKEDKDKQSDIKAVFVVDERLIIVTSQNTVDVKIADLEKIAKGTAAAPVNPAPPPVVSANPALPVEKSANGVIVSPGETSDTQVTEEMVRKKIAESGVWYVFVAHTQRFKVFGQKQYMSMKEGMPLKGAMFNKRLYLQNIDQVLFEPTWENNYDFSRYVSDFNKYMETLRKRLVANVNETNAAQNDYDAAMRNIYFLVDQIVKLLKNRNYTQGALVSKDGDVNLGFIKQEDIEPNAMSFFLELQRKLNKEEHNKRDAEKRIRNLRKEKSELDQYYQQLSETYKSLDGK